MIEYILLTELLDTFDSQYSKHNLCIDKENTSLSFDTVLTILNCIINDMPIPYLSFVNDNGKRKFVSGYNIAKSLVDCLDKSEYNIYFSTKYNGFTMYNFSDCVKADVFFNTRLSTEVVYSKNLSLDQIEAFKQASKKLYEAKIPLFKLKKGFDLNKLKTAMNLCATI